MDTLLSIGLGIGLAAACGFRIFLPLLVMSVAAQTGHLELVGSFAWIGSTPALVSFAAATVLEIAAYYVPWVDNLLDAVAGPVAVLAGIVVTASAVGEVDPLLRWTLAVIAGGGAAALVQGATSGLRQLSTVTTFGLGNPIVATAEAGGSFVMAVLAVLAPIVALFAAAAVAILLVVLLWRWRGRRSRSAAPAL